MGNMNIRQEIETLTRDLENCDETCDGIENNKRSGIILNSLFYEGTNARQGLLIVGFNPGIQNEKESKMIGHFKITAPLEWRRKVWDWKKKHIPYYKKMDALINRFKLDSSILWTDIVKCSKKGRGKLSESVIDKCAKKYFEIEAKIIPEDWTVIALGQEAFREVCKRCGDRFVIGIPHPTGSYGLFDKLSEKMEKDQVLVKFLKKLIAYRDNGLKDLCYFRHVWLNMTNSKDDIGCQLFIQKKKNC